MWTGLDRAESWGGVECEGVGVVVVVGLVGGGGGSTVSGNLFVPSLDFFMGRLHICHTWLF